MAPRLYKYKNGYIDVYQAAKWCGVTDSTIRNWLKQSGGDMEKALEKANSRVSQAMRRRAR